MGRIFTIGEMLIDFLPTKTNSLKDVSGFYKMAGGAPANVAIASRRLGSEVYFVGKFADEAFGHFLLETLENNGVKTDYTYKTNEAKTALAFVSNSEDGEREFSFYRDMSADMLLSVEDVKDISLKKNDLVAFCSVGLIDAPLKYATKEFLENAKKSNANILFDPNLRLNLWQNHQELKSVIDEFTKYCDIIKISDDEMKFITGKDTIKEVFDYYNNRGIDKIIITKGKDGVIAKFGNIITEVEGEEVKAVDTTGAGDAFVGAVLYKLSQIDNINTIDENKLEEILRFSNKLAARVTTKKGAIESLPYIEEIE